VVLLILGELRECHWPRAALWGLAALGGLHVALGFGLRVIEASQTRQCVEFTFSYGKYRMQRLGTGAIPLTSNAIVAGDKSFVDLAAILENQRPLYHYAVDISPLVDDAEWNARIALNSFLRGLDRSAFAAEQKEAVDAWVLGPWPRSPAKRGELLASRIACFDEAAADPEAALNHFAVHYVALPARQAPPGYLVSGWSRLQAGPYWEVWERRAGLPPSASPGGTQDRYHSEPHQ
jgi:hypothetical protein